MQRRAREVLGELLDELRLLAGRERDDGGVQDRGDRDVAGPADERGVVEVGEQAGQELTVEAGDSARLPVRRRTDRSNRHGPELTCQSP